MDWMDWISPAASGVRTQPVAVVPYVIETSSRGERVYEPDGTLAWALERPASGS